MPLIKIDDKEIEAPAGETLLGATPGTLPFGWDNEFPAHRVHVPAFAIDEYPVTNADFLEFVRDGGYAEARLWGEEDWAWRTRRGLEAPHSWRRGDEGVRVHGLLEDVPFERAAQWPAQVSWAEAAAYAPGGSGQPGGGASVPPASRLRWIFIAQNFGPHIEQYSACL